jgi:hypothetical protein
MARAIHAAGEEAEVLHDLALAERDAGLIARALAHMEESLAVSRSIGASAEEVRAAGLLAELQAEVTA